MVLKKDEKEKASKTVMYMLETINVLVENQKILLKRIVEIEGHLEMMAGKILDDIDKDDRIIN
tara:strand:+ start:321 stop:509 length:189 start_codon:yes stop_codon:yes gene_type:complete